MIVLLFVALRDTFQNSKPIKFPKVWLTIFNCGVVEIVGNVQFAVGGRLYPKVDACVDVGIGYRFS